jgi:hypothetical protein
MNDAKSRFFNCWGSGFPIPALGSAIGIYGPPGTAKTTIVKNRISKILGRVCVYFLGGAGIPVFWTGIHTRMRGSS